MKAIDMNEEKVRQLIRDELAYLIKTDKFVFNRLIQLLDGKNIQLGRTNGTQIGTASDQKLGFYGISPVDQPETVADPTGGGTAGVDSSARGAISALIDRLQEVGLIK